MNDTPRTDEQVNGKPCTRLSLLAGDSLRDALVPAEFARGLERENAKLRETVNHLREGLEALEAMQTDVTASKIAKHYLGLSSPNGRDEPRGGQSHE